MGPDRDVDRTDIGREWVLASEALGSSGDLAMRSGDETDIDTVHAIESLAHPTPWSRAIFERELELDWSHLWVIQGVETQRTVAFLVFWTIHDEIHILNVAVHPDFRRRGVASRVIDRLGERASELGFSFITLEVREHNAPAIALYESMGFDVTGRREEYYADTGEAALLMHRLI